ncbi:MAG: hypothetical protein QXO86_02975 [Nitrososphaerota archaeon]
MVFSLMVRLKPQLFVRLAVKVLGVIGLVISVQMIQALFSLEMGAMTVFPYVAIVAFAALLVASILAILA